VALIISVLALVPESDRNQPRLNLDLDDLPTERTLGVLYDSESDHFIFDVKCNVEANTKHQILSAVSTLYDPLGFLSPIVLSAKRILQELWLVGVDWDQSIPDSIMQQWNRWTATLNTLKDFKVLRDLTLSNELILKPFFNGFSPRLAAFKLSSLIVSRKS
jgi:hypothetical protein